ncbi:MAG: DUF1461 domain-containing protein [Chloroflexi bacterium]|nr:DUF1461 domain-containing protein [Chloroflexota bacterium]
MKAAFLAAKIIFALCIPVLLLTATIHLAMSSPALYRYGFEKYDVSALTGISSEDLRHVAGSLADYLTSDQESWTVIVERNGRQVQLLSDLEVEHFKDVKALVQFDYRAEMVALLVILAFILGVMFLGRRAATTPGFNGPGRELASAAMWGSILILGIIALLGLGGAVFGFERLLLGFHLSFFNNDLWLARPGAIMTTLFQEDFLRDAAVFIAAGIVVEATILATIGWYFSRARRAVEAKLSV